MPFYFTLICSHNFLATVIHISLEDHVLYLYRLSSQFLQAQRELRPVPDEGEVCPVLVR